MRWKFVSDGGALALAEDLEQIMLPVIPANTADSFLGGSGLLLNGVNVSFLGMKDFRFVRQ